VLTERYTSELFAKPPGNVSKTQIDCLEENPESEIQNPKSIWESIFTKETKLNGQLLKA